MYSYMFIRDVLFGVEIHSTNCDNHSVYRYDTSASNTISLYWMQFFLDNT